MFDKKKLWEGGGLRKKEPWVCQKTVGKEGVSGGTLVPPVTRVFCVKVI